jgi:ABC-type phosphate transport system substrate-binding protein
VPANNEMHIVNPPKKYDLAYPICTFTYVIVPQQTAHAAELRKLIFWALTQGQKPEYEAKLMFAPLPKPVLVAAEKTLKTIHT